MAQVDYYKALGIEKGATPDDIKKAFRKLAVKYHPDRNPDNKGAEDKFKEINEAYAVLSDPEKKQQYDTFGSSGFHKQYSQEDIFRGFDFGNAYKDMGGGVGGGGSEDLFSRLFGGSFGRGGGRGGFRAGPQKGSDHEMELTVTFRDAAQGAEKQIAFRRNGQREELKVKIPAGVDNGSKIRISGKGAQGDGGGPAGDLFLIIHVLPDPVFIREGGDLFVERSIPFSAACLGISLDVPTLEGDKRIKVPAGMQPGTKIRLKGCGIKALGSNAKGDLYVKIGVHIPETLNGEQKKLVEALAIKGLSCCHQHNRMGGNPLSGATETEPFLSRSLYVDLGSVGVQHAGNVVTHGLNMGRHLRHLGDDSGIEITELVAPFIGQPHNVGQQLQAVCPLVGRVAVGKMPADIPFTDRPQNAVGNGM